MKLCCCFFLTFMTLQQAADEPNKKPSTTSKQGPNPAEIEFFEKKIRPILAEHCYACHGKEKTKAGLRLDIAEAVSKGSDNGKIIEPGHPEKSVLIKAIKRETENPMPPKEKLSDEAVSLLTAWVKMGAPWPIEGKKPADDSWKMHWAFQPIRASDFQTKPGMIDHWISSKLRKENFSLSVPSDRRTLYRRAKYDLLGLPASFEEIELFVSDPKSDDDAFAVVVDRLLSDQAFGEHWGRHWLDLARYADNKGYIGVGVDRTYPFAWTYRDWVIQAINNDMPYDQFLVHQIASDLTEPRENDKRDLAALGFQTVGRRFIDNIHDIIDDRLDTTFRTSMGLTIACARCHDHKYDPISMKDYYGLYGVFASSREPDLDQMPFLGMNVDAAHKEAFEKELSRLKEDLAKFEKDNAAMKKDKPREFEEKIKPFQNRIKKLHADHAGAPPRGMVLLDKKKPVEPVVFNRGNPANRGEKVTRQFPIFLSHGKPKPFAMGSGRWEMARAIVDPSNPLTARVAANRIWMYLIGQPLVRTPSDFGLRSEPPTHPELLDDLASELIQSGWSVKHLIRQIMLSRTYRQSSDAHESLVLRDPENRLLGHMNRKRLSWEGMRDGLLFVSGQLDRTMGGPSIELTHKNPKPRRTVYGFIDRQNLPGLFRTFDFALPDTHAPVRFTTTVPQQALYFLNNEFIQQQAQVILKRKDVQSATEPSARMNRLCQICLARNALAEEVEWMTGFRRDSNSSDTWSQIIQSLLMLNEWMFVD